MSPSDLLVPSERELVITNLALTENAVVVLAASTAGRATCPVCGSESKRIHSRYRRTIADLPFGGRVFILRLVVRRFRCDNADCERSIFCERFPQWLSPHARSTNRLQGLHREIGVTAGGEAGSRLAENLAIPISGDTLIRRLLSVPEPSAEPVRCLGVDDFAFRKGRNYGTILIDLERGRVIDILRSRDSADVEAWLKAHPSIEVITRDRAVGYANAATSGAPQATQVADRWHLLKNLREAVERLLDRRRKLVQKQLTRPAPFVSDLDSLVIAENSAPSPTPPVPTVREQTRDAKRRQRMELYERARELHAAGDSIRRIATLLDLDRETVTRYVQAESFPERQTPSRGTTTYRDHIDQRLNNGCRNAAELHGELLAAGHAVSYYSVRRYVRRRLLAAGDDAVKQGAPVQRTPTSKQLAFAIIRRPEERTEEEQSQVESLKGIVELHEAMDLFILLAAMMRGLTTLKLTEWLTKADASECAELRGFARSLRQDEFAVEAGMSQKWSNGPVEGHVNRLKLLKRQMYGRARFELLRARVCAA